MTDLEMTEWCSYTTGMDGCNTGKAIYLRVPSAGGSSWLYDPLHNDEQAMALVKRFVSSALNKDGWSVHAFGGLSAYNDDLNRAVVEAVAYMQLDRTKLAQSG